MRSVRDNSTKRGADAHEEYEDDDEDEGRANEIHRDELPEFVLRQSTISDAWLTTENYSCFPQSQDASNDVARSAGGLMQQKRKMAGYSTLKLRLTSVT